MGILIGAYKGVEASQEPLNGFIHFIPIAAPMLLVMQTFVSSRHQKRVGGDP